jgi:hypothetical protein
MNFPLQELEKYVDETSLLRGEELFADGKVQKLFETERHLWVAEVVAEHTYEVEVKISPSKVLAATCECDRFLADRECGHVTAVLFALRRAVEQKKKKKEKRKKGPSRPRKLTTGAVLENVEPKELLAFVRQYAKTNRNFALALKARFTSNVSAIESKDKYLQLLDSTLSVARKPDRTISLRGSRKILKVLAEIQAQIEDAIAREYFAEAITMAQSIIEKITPVLRKLENHQDDLRDHIIKAFDYLRETVDRQPPPDLLVDLWDYLMRECRKLTYRNNEIDTFFYRLMLRITEEKWQREALEVLLREQAYKYQLEHRNAAPLLICQLRLLEKSGQQMLANELLLQNLTNPDVLRFALRRAQQLGDLDSVKTFALQGLTENTPPAIREEAEELLFRIAREQKDNRNLQRYAHRRFLHTLDFHYYQTLKEVTDHDWASVSAQLLSEVQQLPFAPEKRRAIAEIYLRENQFDLLAAYLRRSFSLDLLQEFTPPLLEQDPEIVFQLYLDVLQQYLQEHLGRKTSRRIRDAIAFLNGLRAEAIAARLVETLRNEYAERHSLMEELETFNAA